MKTSRMLSKLSLTFALIAASTVAHALPNSQNYAKFRKVSLLLREVSPTEQEYKEFSKMSDSEVPAFLDKKILEYTQSNKFNVSLTDRLLESMRFSIKTIDPLYAFVYNMVSNDFPYTSLLNSQDISLDKDALSNIAELSKRASSTYGSSPLPSINPYDFFLALDPEYYKNVPPGTPLRPRSSVEKEQLSGIFSFKRFYSRFPSTVVNSNRKRAAFIFRNFLCDDMIPAIRSTDEDDQKLLKMSVDDANQTTVAHAENARHGNDPQCMACHSKLDPLGKAFYGTNTFLSPFAIKGALRFVDSKQKKISVDFKGIHGMTQAVTAQPEFARCAVKKMWQIFVGTDVPLEEDTLDTLSREFSANRKRLKPLIQSLVKRNLKMESSLNDNAVVTYKQVQPILKRCDQCHSSLADKPKFSVGFPFAKERNQNTAILKKFAVYIGLTGDAPIMPPPYAGWSLNQTEKVQLYSWLQGGARASTGVASLNTSEVSSLKLKVDQNKSQVRYATYFHTYKRILNARSFIYEMIQLFQITEQYRLQNYIPFNPNNNNLPGEINIATGMASARIAGASEQKFYQQAGKNAIPLVNEFSTSQRWAELSSEAKGRAVAAAIDKLLGDQYSKTSQGKNLAGALLKSADASLAQKSLSDVYKAFLLNVVSSTYFTQY